MESHTVLPPGNIVTRAVCLSEGHTTIKPPYSTNLTFPIAAFTSEYHLHARTMLRPQHGSCLARSPQSPGQHRRYMGNDYEIAWQSVLLGLRRHRECHRRLAHSGD